MNSNSSNKKANTSYLIIFLLLVILGIIIYAAVIYKSKQNDVIPIHPVHPIHIIGGCSGTRYGCCPDGRTSRINTQGTNC